MLISADCSNEPLYVARKFVREVVGSSHLRTSSTAFYGDSLHALQRLYGLAQPLSVLSEADVILCLGFDGKYAQSVVDVELRRAKKAGARLITFNAQEHSVSKSADEWLQPKPGEEAEVLEMLVEGARTGVREQHKQVQRVVQLLRESKRAVVLLGPSFLTHPDSLF